MVLKKILLVEPSPLFCIGLERAFAEFDESISFTKPSSSSDFLSYLANNEVDLIVLNAGFLSQKRLPFIKEISSIYQVPLVLIFDEFTKGFRKIVETVEPEGVLKKSAKAQEFLNAITLVLAGKTYFEGYQCSAFEEKLVLKEVMDILTKKEKEVLGHLLKGSLNKEIAFHMGVSESTVKTHVSKLLKKFGLDNRTAIVRSVISEM